MPLPIALSCTVLAPVLVSVMDSLMLPEVVGETAKVEDIAKVFGILGAARCGDRFTPASVVYVEGPQRTPSGGVKYKVAPPAGTRQYFYRGVMRLAD